MSQTDGSSSARSGLPALAIAGLRKAYFVKKRVKHFAERRCYVLGFTVKSWFRKDRSTAEVQARIREAVSCPGETLILSVEGGNYRFGRKFRWMRGSRIV